MKIKKLIIKNYKLFRDVNIAMNEDVNIFVGDNDSGKTTILEALTMVLTGRINSSSVYNRLNLDWFNADVRNEFKREIEEGNTPMLPEIEIEVYFSTPADEELDIRQFRGSNNHLHEDAEGVKLEIIFDDQYSEAYKQLLADKKIKDIPIEYYKCVFRSFANPEYYVTTTSRKVAYIDTTRMDYGSVVSRFVTSSIKEYLSEDDMTDLRHAYRANRHDFTENQAVKTLNEQLQANHSFEGKRITLNLREKEIDEWKNDMSLLLDDIPLENSGLGTQNMFKSEIFLRQNNDVDVLIIEEPENNLSYSNMSMLISKLSESVGKQLFISTHSSFVANKLGLQHLHLVNNKKIVSLTDLTEETYNYFLKLPGYNTLRLLIANQAILVEGPADELIIQRAYIDYYGKQPIENGIDVISAGGVAFQRYCELAKLINKHITIVTDNDHDIETVRSRYEEYGDLVTPCVEADNNLNTLEPSLLAVNEENFEKFKAIVYHGSDIKQHDAGSILQFMIKNKTEWSMRVFVSNQKINYPQYILEAIGKADADAEGNSDE
ncbi:MAG: AAA family ATPase [Clostridiaceae bacterium]|nr:AAA family ATPase [Clostridiaceae bacterium]